MRQAINRDATDERNYEVHATDSLGRTAMSDWTHRSGVQVRMDYRDAQALAREWRKDGFHAVRVVKASAPCTRTDSGDSPDSDFWPRA